MTDDDASELLKCFETLISAGKHVTIMAHYDHWRELQTPIAETAVRLLRSAGVTIRNQGPLLNHINNSADVWSRMWQQQVKLGIIPYYLFVERDTGARHYVAGVLQWVTQPAWTGCLHLHNEFTCAYARSPSRGC